MWIHQGWWQIVSELSTYLSFSSSTSLERQSAALFWAPNIHSKVMLYVASVFSIHLFTLLLAFFPLRNLASGLWSLHMINFCSLEIIVPFGDCVAHSTSLLVLWCTTFSVYPWRYAKERLLEIPCHHVLVRVVLYMHHLIHLCRVCIILMDLDNIG